MHKKYYSHFTKSLLKLLLNKGFCSFLATLCISSSALAQLEPGQEGIPPAFDKPLNISFCIFDPVGATGDAYREAKDLSVEALKWNVHTELKVYNDERVAVNDFKAKLCDGMAVSTLRAKEFNLFMGSIDSVGSIPSYKHMRAALQALASPAVVPYTISGDYQIVGVIPLGAAYVFVNDKSIDSVEKAAGKRIAVLDWDKSQAEMVKIMGGSPVGSEITNFAGKFNNHQVDIIVSPALLYRPFELYKGLGDKGGIYHFPLIMITGSIVINRAMLREKIPNFDKKIEDAKNNAQLMKLREYAFSRIEKAYALIDKSEAEIDPKYWVELPSPDKIKYNNLMREVRIQLTKKGYYDPRMMRILKRVRCTIDPTNAECSLTDE